MNEPPELDSGEREVQAKNPSVDSMEVREGSPFADEPDQPAGSVSTVHGAPAGSLQYTALGAVAAAVMLIGFAAASLPWFPVGGAVIAGLGCAMSAIGFLSNRPLLSSALLAIHAALFSANYIHAIP